MVAFTAPQREWPRTIITLAPNTNVPNSRLPISSEVAKFPATRQTNRSPNPRSKTISAGTRESAQPKIAAKGA